MDIIADNGAPYVFGRTPAAGVIAVSGTGAEFDCDLSFALLRLTPLTLPGASATAPDENVKAPERRPGRIDLEETDMY